MWVDYWGGEPKGMLVPLSNYGEEAVPPPAPYLPTPM